MNINEIIKKEEEQSHKKFLAYIIADMIYIHYKHYKNEKFESYTVGKLDTRDNIVVCSSFIIARKNKKKFIKMLILFLKRNMIYSLHTTKRMNLSI